MHNQRTFVAFAREILRQSRKRAKVKNLDHTLTLKEIEELWIEQGGVCAYSGLEFNDDVAVQTNHKRPFIPSLHRLDNSRGYHKDNVAIVCYVSNVAIFTWGEDLLDKMVKSRSKRLFFDPTDCTADTRNTLRKAKKLIYELDKTIESIING